MSSHDEDVYLDVLNEFDNGKKKESLWAKALTLEKGDIKKAKYSYIQLRVGQLKEEKVQYENQISEISKIKKSKPVNLKFTDPNGIGTNLTVACLSILALVTIAAIVSDWLQYSMLENINWISQEEADRNDARVSFVDNFHFVTMLLSGLAVLIWRYKANRNCWYYGAEQMRFTPEWAVGWSLVPVMNLFRPYQVMQEIWKISTDPETWKNQQSSVLIKWWWFFCLVDVFFGRVFSRLAIKGAFKEETVDQLKQVTSASIASSITTLIACIFTLSLVLEIRKRQLKLGQKRSDNISA